MKDSKTVQNRKQLGDVVTEFAAGLPVIWGTGYPVSTAHVLCTEHFGVWWARKFPEGDDGSSSAKYSDSLDIFIKH